MAALNVKLHRLFVKEICSYMEMRNGLLKCKNKKLHLISEMECEIFPI